jgi:hypothetical protein
LSSFCSCSNCWRLWFCRFISWKQF